MWRRWFAATAARSVGRSNDATPAAPDHLRERRLDAGPGSRTVWDTGGATQSFDSADSDTVATSGSALGFAAVRRVDGTVTEFQFELRRQPGGFGSTDTCFLHGFLLSGR